MPDDVVRQDEFVAFETSVNGKFSTLETGIANIWTELQRINNRKTWINGGLVIFGSALGSGIVQALQHMHP
ncbi:hypothetical protein FKW31_10175 [Acetobacter sp. DmW_136]|uniref:hypothetical protein n=1 Tax=Acetobacter sp. DmW_136 TaxID=2591091 RepID=UPI00123C6B0A|nr:hypothetical protein [Acetobacter sp. DmW_136]KAA8385168.1 hypothetical protein FKW31_10175 [Acetobacter sp. DmW_136]